LRPSSVVPVRSTAAMQQSHFRWVLLSTVLLFAVLIYTPALTGGFFFDDFPNIVDGGTVKLPALSPAYLLEAAFPQEVGSGTRPLSRLSFAINWYLSGMDPFAFKLVNLVLHGLNAALVLLFVYQLLVMCQTNRPATRMPPPWLLATSVALLWAAAPIHANTVPYIVQRMVLLCSTFSLIALIAYLRLRLAAAKARHWSALGWGSLAGISAMLALLSKETGVLIPVYIAVMEATLLYSGRPGRARTLTSLLALGVAALPLAGLALYLMADPGWLNSAYRTRDFGLVERFMSEWRVVLTYLINTVIPRLGQIHFYYDNLPISQSLLSPPTTLLSLAALVGLVFAALMTRVRWPLFAFAVLWFLGGHALEGTVLPLELVFWHRNYLPSLGPLMLVAWGLVWFLTQRGDYYRVGFVLVALVAILFTGQTLALAHTWGSPLRMAFAEYTSNPNSPRAAFESGRQSFIMYLVTKEPRYLDQTGQYFARTVELEPRNLLALWGLLKLKLSFGYSAPFDPYQRILETLGQGVLPLGPTTTMDSVVRLSDEEPDKLDLFDVLALFDAIDANPRLSPRDKAQALIIRANFITNRGFPVSQGLDLLREARCRAPDDFAVRIRLLEGLSAAGQLDEAETLLTKGFSRWERWVSVSTRYAEQLIAHEKAATRTLPPVEMPSSGVADEPSK